LEGKSGDEETLKHAMNAPFKTKAKVIDDLCHRKILLTIPVVHNHGRNSPTVHTTLGFVIEWDFSVNHNAATSKNLV
jgi:hypothetical protein